MDYVLLMLALFFITASQVLQKLAAVSAARQPAGSHFLRRLITRKETWWAVVSLATGTFFWLAVLYRMEVSKALPFLSLSSVLVLLASRYYLGETIGRATWAGVVVIVIGIGLLSQS